MRRHGSSLLKATMDARSDPAQARLADVSFSAVPEPIPRTLRKHDQVTIIVREESEFRSRGTTELKKEAEFEARLEEFIRLKIHNAEIEGGAIGTNPPAISSRPAPATSRARARSTAATASPPACRPRSST